MMCAHSCGDIFELEVPAWLIYFNLNFQERRTFVGKFLHDILKHKEMKFIATQMPFLYP